ncbi:MAG: GntR family transcriptional regulator [Gemmatimonadaceae bacterium]
MLPFVVEIKTGESASAQVVYSATRAILSGELSAGQAFPSVRELSLELKINPNTAHKIVAELLREGLLEVRPGVGTIVATVKSDQTDEQYEAVEDLVEGLIVEARRAGMGKVELLGMVGDQWKALFGTSTSRKNKRTNDD